MGVRFLLDTHVLLWLLGPSERIPAEVRQTLGSLQNELVVSSISAFEIATKHRLGKLNAWPVLESWSENLRLIGAVSLDIRAEHGVLAGTLAWDHRDPWDRMLVAQAQLENLTLVTVDDALQGLDSPTILTW